VWIHAFAAEKKSRLTIRGSQRRPSVMRRAARNWPGVAALCVSFMKLGYKLLTLQVLVAACVLLFLGQFASAPLIYGRLLAFFLLGVVMALFVQGPQYGTIDPVSTRPIMIGLGVVMMGASLVWAFVIRNHL
jgi:hypothetical protein